jgi:hypothetical protein
MLELETYALFWKTLPQPQVKLAEKWERLAKEARAGVAAK